MKWACTIARFQSLAHRRKMGRDRLVFCDEIHRLIEDEPVGRDHEREMVREALERSLAELSEEQRHLVVLSHTSGIKMTEVSREMGLAVSALYMRLTRLRRKLFRSVNSKMKVSHI